MLNLLLRLLSFLTVVVVEEFDVSDRSLLLEGRLGLGDAGLFLALCDGTDDRDVLVPRNLVLLDVSLSLGDGLSG